MRTCWQEIINIARPALVNDPLRPVTRIDVALGEGTRHEPLSCLVSSAWPFSIGTLGLLRYNPPRPCASTRHADITTFGSDHTGERCPLSRCCRTLG
jgi:hypothetical protein